MQRSHLDILLANFRNAIRVAANEAYENLIPPWCEGIDNRLWDTEVGKELANLFWFDNKAYAISLRNACKIIWPDKSLDGVRGTRYSEFVARHCRIYPRVKEFYREGKSLTERNPGWKARWYVRRDDAELLHLRILRGEFTLGTGGKKITPSIEK